MNRNIIGLIEVIAEYKSESRAMKQIRFYRLNEPYGEFSNFSPHPIELKGLSLADF